MRQSSVHSCALSTSTRRAESGRRQQPPPDHAPQIGVVARLAAGLLSSLTSKPEGRKVTGLRRFSGPFA